MKKNSSKNEAVQPTTAVVNEAATASSETTKKASSRRKAAKKTEQAQQPEAEQKQEKPKAQKFVEVRIFATFLQARTEKAQLVKFKKDEEQVKIWLPLAHISLTPEAENFTICRMPAWLYYRSGMREAFPDVRWSAKKEDAEKAEPQDGYANQQERLMQQFHELKAKHPDALLLFRNDEAYESYSNDAETIAQVLGLALGNTEDKQACLVSFPISKLDTYLPMLIRKGHRVAICDALESPKAA